jgi:hypothetical protein
MVTDINVNSIVIHIGTGLHYRVTKTGGAADVYYRPGRKPRLNCVSAVRVVRQPEGGYADVNYAPTVRLSLNNLNVVD